MKYINKNTGDVITREVYVQLNDSAKNNFIQMDDTVNTVKTHTIVETKSDNLSVGDAIAVVALSPVIAFKALFG